MSSKPNHLSFGEILRDLRQRRAMPLRELASLLEMDQSTLSKIERNERTAGKVLIEKISVIFKIPEKELRINLISDIVVYELRDETDSIDILKVAEEKIEYLRAKKKKKK
jgi:transcriptional regulator with XRE-family HTH domain